MIDNETLEAKLQTRPAPRVTKADIEARIEGAKFERLSDTLTHCIITLDNGYMVTGESACVDIENYDREIGERIAYDNAFAKLWALFGFLLAERRFINASK